MVIKLSRTDLESGVVEVEVVERWWWQKTRQVESKVRVASRSDTRRNALGVKCLQRVGLVM